MATKHNTNWMKLKAYLNRNSNHEVEESQNDRVSNLEDAVHAQLKKKMAKEVLDARMRQAVYGYLQMM